MNFQSARALQIKPSPSMVVSLAARKMRAAGDDVIDLSLGEPDFDTPAHIIEAAYRAMKAGQTRYTGPDGSEELRAAIAAKFRRENGLDYAMDEIVVANGAKQIIFNALLATLEPGDEVIMPAPYLVSYTEMVVLHGGVARIVECGVENGFRLTPERLEAAITPTGRDGCFSTPRRTRAAQSIRATNMPRSARCCRAIRTCWCCRTRSTSTSSSTAAALRFVRRGLPGTCRTAR